MFSEPLLLAALAIVAPTAGDEALRDRFHVVRIDAENQRLFVAPSEALLLSSDSVERYLDDLAPAVSERFPTWGTDWSVSFFKSAELAAYKTDESVREAVRDGRWASAYLAEYDHGERKLVRDPLDADKTSRTRVGSDEQAGMPAISTLQLRKLEIATCEPLVGTEIPGYVIAARVIDQRDIEFDNLKVEEEVLRDTAWQGRSVDTIDRFVYPSRSVDVCKRFASGSRLIVALDDRSDCDTDPPQGNCIFDRVIWELDEYVREQFEIDD
jgi:hypothetical protein